MDGSLVNEGSRCMKRKTSPHVVMAAFGDVLHPEKPIDA